MKKSELKQIIREEIQRLTEAQYTDQTGVISSLIKQDKFKSLFDDSNTIKWLKSPDLRLFLSTKNEAIFTDGKYEMRVHLKTPYNVIQPLNRAGKLAKDLYNREPDILHITETTQLLATSPSLDGIQKLISQYLYGSTITLDKTSDRPETYSVSTKKGKSNNFRVIKKGKRYRFERL